ncbi:MAG: hypothetical protein J6Y78_15710 [Paludibacteraceae bacterium]|nr:hypothetical protein [Paludibacteraceae bacterium]
MATSKKIKIEVENNNGNTEVMDLPERATERIEIKKVPVEKVRVKIVGDTPLLVHAWSEKVKKQLLNDMQMSKREKKEKEHEKKDPFADFVEAAYWITPMPQVRGLPSEEQIKLFEEAIKNGAQFGFPTIAFKKAAITACYSAGYIKSTTLMRRLFHVNAVNGAHVGSSQELAILNIEEPPELSEDVVKVGPFNNRVPDLRYRPSFRKWSVELELSLIKTGMFTMEDIINAVDMSGFMNGVGEWRTEKDGEFGSYHIYREGE